MKRIYFPKTLNDHAHQPARDSTLPNSGEEDEFINNDKSGEIPTGLTQAKEKDQNYKLMLELFNVKSYSNNDIFIALAEKYEKSTYSPYFSINNTY
jgi:hypothetical protein